MENSFVPYVDQQNFNVKNLPPVSQVVEYFPPTGEKTVRICRCWQSATFPLCNGVHKTQRVAVGQAKAAETEGAGGVLKAVVKTCTARSSLYGKAIAAGIAVGVTGAHLAASALRGRKKENAETKEENSLVKKLANAFARSSAATVA